jgi:Outer membrane protein beta-barrel domain
MKHVKILFAGLLLLGCFSVPQHAEAQRDRPRFKQNPKHQWSWFERKKYWSFGVGLNAMNYFGDITPQPDFTSLELGYTRPNISVWAMKRLYPGVSLRYHLSWGRIKGSDMGSVEPGGPRWEQNQFRYIRNLSFRSDLWEVGAVGVFDLVKNRGVFFQRPNRVVPYLTAGLTFFRHNPRAVTPDEFGGDWVALQPLGTEGQGRDGFRSRYSRWQFALPLGVGLRYKISQRWDIAFEVTYRYTLTDYLDDVSGRYADLGVFAGDDLARAMSDRSREGGLARLADTNPGLTYIPPLVTYIGVDGQPYTTYLGFGNADNIDNIRGNVNDRDVLIVTGIHLSYIVPGQVRCPEPFKKRFRRHRL